MKTGLRRGCKRGRGKGSENTGENGGLGDRPPSFFCVLASFPLFTPATQAKWKQKQSNYSEQSQQTPTTRWTNQISMEIRATGTKRGKMLANPKRRKQHDEPVTTWRIRATGTKRGKMLTNHNRRKQHDEPITTRCKYVQRAPSAGKCWLITTDANNTMNQSQLDVNTCNGHQARENAD